MKIRKPINIEHQAEAITIARCADALSHPVRVAILAYVKRNNQVRNDTCNKDLVEHFNYSQSSLSQHVKKLKDAELFTVKYRDKFSFYSVNYEQLNKLTHLISNI